MSIYRICSPNNSGWLHIYIDRQMDRQIDGQIDRQIYRRTESQNITLSTKKNPLKARMPHQNCQKKPKFYLSVRVMLVNADNNVQKLFDQTCLPAVPGPPNLYFLQAQNASAAYAPKKLISTQILNIIYIYICVYMYMCVYIYISSTKSLKKAGRGIKTWF